MRVASELSQRLKSIGKVQELSKTDCDTPVSLEDESNGSAQNSCDGPVKVHSICPTCTCKHHVSSRPMGRAGARRPQRAEIKQLESSRTRMKQAAPSFLHELRGAVLNRPELLLGDVVEDVTIE